MQRTTRIEAATDAGYAEALRRELRALGDPKYDGSPYRIEHDADESDAPFDLPELDDLDGGWIRHDGGECPVHPMDVIEVEFLDGKRIAPTSADSWVWKASNEDNDIVRYRPLRDEDGVPYCSAEGLTDWAEYVATDEDGEAWQYEDKPVVEHGLGEWGAAACRKRHAPHHDNTREHWTKTLRRVWR